ncbi:unnamed protein product [Linum tenue]|uniref:F-box domain-containing protein n=1 Tax=Linum tenue TaxID=586396 RepID=A0AAV0IHD8_9ROSI|nr:unnamed protein product [Linum tenue]
MNRKRTANPPDLLSSMEESKGEQTTATDAQKSPTLPASVIVNVLSKLPARSLFRFRLLSRNYLNLIHSPDFIAAHARDSCLNRAGLLLLAESLSCPVASFLPPAIPDNSCGGGTSIEQLKNTGGASDFPLPFLKGYGQFGVRPSLRFAGSFTGLVCLILHRWGEYWVLWNPATSQFSFAPPPILPQDDCFCNRESPHRVLVGFGYDSEASDYKSVRVCWWQDGGSGVQVEVLSWVKRSWTQIQDRSFQTILTLNRKGTWSFPDPPLATSNGGVYWMDTITGMVLCFKLHDEKLEWISTPYPADSPKWSVLSTISVWKGSLAMFVLTVQDSLLSVCLFDEGDSSWSTLLTIPMLGSPCIPEAIWRVNGCNLFLLYINCVTCDSEGGILKLPFEEISRAFEFAETLVPIPGC